MDKYWKWLYEAIENKSKNIYFLIGPPGVGKSTWIKNNFSDKQHKVISKDEIVDKILYKEYSLTSVDLYRKDRTPEAEEALQKLNTYYDSIVMSVLDQLSDNVIVDMLNADSKTRKNILDRVKNNYPEYKIIGVMFNFEGFEDEIIKADIKRSQERPERKAINPDHIKAVMSRIKADPPTEEEGFDEIQSYNRFKDKEQMKEYNHKQFMDWLNGKLEKETKQTDDLLVESKLSKYWKKRAKRRALKAERQWPNKNDRDWALKEQEKSVKINEKVYALFEKELEEASCMSDDVDKMMRQMKKNRKEYLKKREERKLEKQVKLMHPKDRLKKVGGPSQTFPTKPERGVKKGFDIKRKQAAKKGQVAIAPGAQFGPMEEEKKNENK
jgi:hypothetical protein